jgi:hypothetical protein
MQELEHLLSALCDDALGDAEHRRLNELLESDPECRRCYLEYMDLHARLLAHPALAGEQLADAGRSAEAMPAVLPIRSSEGVPAQPAAFPRVRPPLRYAMVAAAAVAATVLVQVLWLHPRRGSDAERSVSPAIDQAMATPVATLIQAADCAWENPTGTLRVGSRVHTGKLRLQKGLARILLDSGTELILEGPTELRLDSSASATLLFGKAVLRADETSAALELHTPSATLLDFGTEYGVGVGRDSEELQVYEGLVQRVPHSGGGIAEPEYVKAGEARRCSTGTFTSQPIDFDPARFVRRVPAAAGLGAAGLLAYEGFDYPTAEIFTTGQANGGLGWSSPWTVLIARPLLWGEKKLPPLNVEESLVRPDSTAPSIGGKFDHAGFGSYYRQLATPIRMDTDGIYYLSCLFRRAGLAGHPHNMVALMLKPDEGAPPGEPNRPDGAVDTGDAREHHDRHGVAMPNFANRVMIGVGGCNQVFTRVGHECARASTPINSGVNYLLVAKIVAGAWSPDQVFVRVYGPREPIGDEEPLSWTVVSPSVHSRLVLSWLGIHVNSKNRQMVDEIRVGTTWSSVTGPWVTVPAPPKAKKA